MSGDNPFRIPRRLRHDVEQIFTLTEAELTAAFRDRSLYNFSAHRQAAAVLDMRAQRMTLEEVEAVLAGMTRLRFPFAADRVRLWRSTLVTLDAEGYLTLDRISPDLGTMQSAVRKLARPVLVHHAQREHWTRVREKRELVMAEERQRQGGGLSRRGTCIPIEECDGTR